MEHIGKFFQDSWNTVAEDSYNIVWNLVKIVAIFIAAKILILILRRIVNKIFKRIESRYESTKQLCQRMETMRNLTNSIVRYVIYFFAIVSVLGVLGLGSTVASLLATAGIGGLAIAFGAQGLVKDVVTGLFLLFEDQYDVGDVVRVGGEEGTVESITIRYTRLKKGSGEITTIPNGNISQVTNFCRSNSIAAIDIPLPYETDIPRVSRIIHDVAVKYADENDHVLDTPGLPSMTALGESNINLKMVLKVKPLTNGRTEIELRPLIKDALAREEIDPPYPKRVMLQ